MDEAHLEDRNRGARIPRPGAWVSLWMLAGLYAAHTIFGLVYQERDENYRLSVIVATLLTAVICGLLGFLAQRVRRGRCYGWASLMTGFLTFQALFCAAILAYAGYDGPLVFKIIHALYVPIVVFAFVVLLRYWGLRRRDSAETRPPRPSEPILSPTDRQDPGPPLD